HQHPDFDRYDFNSRGFLAESLASWLASKSGVPINIRRPFDYFAFTLQLLGLLALGIVVYAMYNRGVKVIRSKYLWAGLSLFTIFIMISGHMWNQIRNPPISMPGHDGQPGYIAAGFQTQFRLEALIVAVICMS
ncbi:oligosaccharyl transferase subunit ost3/OST6, partial [Mortierella sp. AM989]